MNTTVCHSRSIIRKLNDKFPCVGGKFLSRRMKRSSLTAELNLIERDITLSVPSETAEK